MTDLFKQALAKSLVHEGGKVDHPADPGGRTNKGVTQRVYNGWRGKNNLPNRDVYEISDDEVEAIYRFQYWEPVKGDQLPPGVGYVVFDGAVNSGPKQSVKWLQRALGFDPSQVDGVLGAVTMSGVSDEPDHDALISRIIDRREAFLRALRTFKTFGKGWLRRIRDVETVGQAWAAGSVGPAIDFIPGGNAKAGIEDAKRPPKKSPGDVGMGVGGAGGVGGSGVLQALQDQLNPFASGVPWVKTLIVYIIIAGFVIAAGGMLYRLYANKKAAELADALDVKVA